MQPSFRIPWGIFCEMGAAFMENRIVVMGGRPLNGAVRIPAAKNSVLPLLAASMLCGDVRLRAVPRLSDVAASLALLRGAGCAARWEGEDILVSGTPQNSSLPGQTAEQMRSSILFCAPLLAKLGRAETSLPGGCNIGARPIDLHLAGLRQMGAVEWEAGPGRLVLTAPSGLHGAEITLRFPSVGATETLVLAAACARGTTVLRGAAREPEIADLAAFLNRCGAHIQGAGSSTLCIEGRRNLSGCVFSPLPDRIFASTLACAVAAAGGRAELSGCPASLYAPVLEILEQMGCTVERGADRAEVARLGRLYGAGRVLSVGTLPESGLHGAALTAPDLRGGAALVVAALSARGKSLVEETRHIDRGYAGLWEVLASLGGRIGREMPALDAAVKKIPSKKQIYLAFGAKR